MNWQMVDPRNWQALPVRTFAEGMLLTAKCGEETNTMTVGWGGFGFFFGKPTVLFGVRPSRFTFHLTEGGDEISLSVLPPGDSALSYCGTHTGKAGDKAAAAGLTALTLPGGGMGFSEAEAVISGRTVYSIPMSAAGFRDRSIVARWYKDGDFHTIYVAEILGIYIRV